MGTTTRGGGTPYLTVLSFCHSRYIFKFEHTGKYQYVVYTTLLACTDIFWQRRYLFYPYHSRSQPFLDTIKHMIWPGWFFQFRTRSVHKICRFYDGDGTSQGRVQFVFFSSLNSYFVGYSTLLGGSPLRTSHYLSVFAASCRFDNLHIISAAWLWLKFN